MPRMKIVAIQMPILPDKEANVEAAAHRMKELRSVRPDVVILPEMFCCPYQTESFPVYAEEEGGPTWRRLSALAAEHGVYLVAGSVPERDAAGRVYNTCYVFDRAGRQIGRHRKMHLFDIDVRVGQYFKESDTLTAGDAVTVFDTEFGKMGVMICFDIRFPELARLTADAGARVIFVPAAFNMTTGPAHWELTFRARALDNQVYMAGCSAARDPKAGYVAWGHSIVTDPWGRVLAQLDEKPGLLTVELDLDQADAVRKQLPLLSARRGDVYRLETVKQGLKN